MSIISVIGPGGNLCSKEIYDFGLSLGEKLVEEGYFICCGGKNGIMEAVCKGARNAANHQFGKTIGIIPELEKQYANAFCDIVIPTGLQMARNQLVVSTGDLVIAISGGAGTLSELAFAWQMNKKVICYTGFAGWSQKLANQNLDTRQNKLLIPACNLDEILFLLKENLKNK